MNRTYLAIGLAAGLSLVSMAQAATCDLTTWTFGGAMSNCGTSNNGVTFTTGGQSLTISAEQYYLTASGSHAAGDFKSAGSLWSVDGLFEVKKGSNGNIASGIAPYDPRGYGPNNSGNGVPYTDQLGITDVLPFGDDQSNYGNLLLLEISNTGGGAVADGTTLKFLMQEGFQDDSFNIWTTTSATNTVPVGLSAMSEVVTNQSVGVGAEQGNASGPQAQFATTTSVSKPYEFIAIQADCDYLLLNSVTSTPPGHTTTPEPRFIGLLLVGMLAIPAIRRRFAVQQ